MHTETVQIRMNNFEERVLELVATRKISYIDAAIVYCDEVGVDPEYLKHVMTDPIKQKLEAEARELNFLPKLEDEPLPFE